MARAGDGAVVVPLQDRHSESFHLLPSLHFCKGGDVCLSFILPFFLEGWLANAEFELVVFNLRSLDPWEGDVGVPASVFLKGFVKCNGEKRVFSSLTACYNGQYHN